MESQSNEAPASPGGLSAPAPAPPPVVADKSPLSIEEAAASYARRRQQEANAEQTPPAPEDKPDKTRAPNGRFAKVEAPDASEIPAAEAGAAPPQEARGETVEPDPADDLPPIEPPRSWSKEDKELFSALPRETQERLAERERSRESDFSRRQQEATEARKAAEAERQQMESNRRQYEQALPNLLQVIQQQAMAEFSDIKSMDDVQRLAADDPLRFAQFQARQMQIEHVARETRAAQARQEQEQQTKFKEWAEEQDREFAKIAPEFSDPEKVRKAQGEVLDYLTTVRGVPKESLDGLWNGLETISLRNAKVQAIVRDAAKYNAMVKAAKQAVPQAIPPVQRPGPAAPRASSADAQIKTLEARFNETRSIADAAALRAARRAAGVR